MPIKGGRRTDKEALFIGHLASSGDPTYAAAKAGYSQPATDGWKKTHNPAIVEAVRKAQTARLNNDLLPKSLDLLEMLITDGKRADRVRLAAAQTVLKYSLGQAEGADAKEPHEMTPAELQARIDTLRRAMADKAKPVIEGKATAPDQGVFD